MDEHDVDLFVIGGGSGGVRAARIAARHGARVAIAEESRWGGTCVIRGCIPKKLFVYASEYAHEFEEAAGYGWDVKATFDWSRLLANKDKEIARLSELYVGNLRKHKVQIFDGRAVLKDAHTIECAGKTVTAKHILIATGGTPSVPDLPGREHAITSDEAFHLEALPKRVAVVGGGYIGVEFAHIFAGLGCDVTAIHRRDLMLRGFDESIRRAVTDNLGKAGIETHLCRSINTIEKLDGGLRVTLDDSSTVDVDQILFATGRAPNTRGLGLDAAGVETNAGGAIQVDEYSQTSVPHIFAVGDCTGRVDLTPVAIRDGHAVADALFGDSRRAIDHETIPTAVFCQPPAATVGLTEEQAKAAEIRYECLETSFRPLRATVSGSSDRVVIKALISKYDDLVIGVHMVGKDSPEIIQALAVAIKKGVTRADLKRTVALHPTTAEEIVLL